MKFDTKRGVIWDVEQVWLFGLLQQWRLKSLMIRPQAPRGVGIVHGFDRSPRIRHLPQNQAGHISDPSAASLAQSRPDVVTPDLSNSSRSGDPSSGRRLRVESELVVRRAVFRPGASSAEVKQGRHVASRYE